MRSRKILISLILSNAMLLGSCHLFDDFEEISESCPFNSAYPCACDPQYRGGFCDDDSVCVFWEANGEQEGFCSKSCSSPVPCIDTKAYGLDGSCWLRVQSETENQCIVVCMDGDKEESCPPGLECYENAPGFGVCIPPTAIESGSDCQCSDNEYRCDEDEISACKDGCNWTNTPCSEVCADMGGYSGDCSYDTESGHDVCWCNGTSDCECTKDTYQCVGDSINICIDECNWTLYSCDEICKDMDGYSGDCSYDTESGHDVCWCGG
ncbi:MAG: hypothetical protein GY847_04875 [Proteobacteria bacterium]|nr:hypothetical protein [Pseudomonadota bacterium]